MSKKSISRQKGYFSLLNLNPNPIIGLDDFGKVTFANFSSKKALSQLNTGLNPVFFVPRDIKNILKRLTQNKKERFQRKINIGKNTFSEIIQYSPELKLTLLYATDTTKYLQTKKDLDIIKQDFRKRLKKSIKLNELNRTIMDNAPISIITTNNKGDIISKNKYYKNFSRTNKKRNSNIFTGEFFIRENLVDDYKKLLTQGTTVIRENCYEQNKAGEDKYLKIIAVPLRDSKGEIKGALSMAIDNTEIILLQNNLLESYNHAGVINRRVAFLRDIDRLFENPSGRKKDLIERMLFLLNKAFEATFTVLFVCTNESAESLQSICSIEIKKQRKKNIEAIKQNISKILPKLKKNKVPIEGFYSSFNFIQPKIKERSEYFTILPIIWENKLRATVFIGLKEKKDLDQQEIEFLEVFFSHASMLLIRAKLLP